MIYDDGTTSQYVGIAGSERDVPKIHDGAKMWYDRETPGLGEAGNRAVTTYGSAEVTSWTTSGKRELTPEELAKINADLPEGVFLISGLEVPSQENILPVNASVKGETVATAWSLPGDEQDSVPNISKKASVFNMSLDNEAYNWNRIKHEFPLLKMISIN